MKNTYILVTLCLALLAFAGCSQDTNTTDQTQTDTNTISAQQPDLTESTPTWGGNESAELGNDTQF